MKKAFIGIVTTIGFLFMNVQLFAQPYYGRRGNNCFAFGNNGMPFFHFGGMFMGLIFLVLLIVVIVLLVNKNKHKEIHHSQKNSIELAKIRFAKGEISKEEYLEIVKTLTE